MSIQPMIIQHYFFGTTRNLLAGAGLCYTIQNENYLQAPLTILFPSIYAGYHLYKNRHHLAHWSKVLRQ
jgi:hypothetical protein